LPGRLDPDELARCRFLKFRGTPHSQADKSLLDQNGNPRVTDFGLAKKVAGDSGLTGSGQIMGTPSYMPPEQAGGKRADVGLAADVYSLGATLYALVAGRPPFQAATAMDTVIQVLSDEPIPPRRLNTSIPRDLETICLRGRRDGDHLGFNVGQANFRSACCHRKRFEPCFQLRR
jgi:serine/threonine protein kinase